jgi:hypothetical protein
LGKLISRIAETIPEITMDGQGKEQILGTYQLKEATTEKPVQPGR